MKPHIPIIALLALALASCDKAKSIANKASSAVKDKIAANIGKEASGKVDPELQKLVDQTPEGVIFRKDLPFPARLEVRTTRRREMTGRFYQSSAIEKRADTVKGTQVTVMKLERSANQVRYTLEQSSFTIPTPDKPDAAPQAVTDPLEQVAPSNKPVTFTRNGKAWRSDDRDGFRAAVLSKQLTPVFDELLIENALAPRSLWFGKHRFRIGEQLSVTGDMLPMLLAGHAKGSFTLKLESLEPVDGHPCGVFSVTGDFSRKQFPDFEGNLTDEDVTVQSGKLWLSLIHPVILREELETIQTFKSGGQGGAVSRGQGAIKVSVKRDWKPLPP
jgi:hypothetical protein